MNHNNETPSNTQINLEAVLKAADNLVFTKTGKHLKAVEIAILQGAWQRKTYEQIAANNRFSLTYIKQAAAPRLWKLLTKILKADVRKTNFRSAIEENWEASLKPLLTSSQENRLPLEQKSASVVAVDSERIRDWDEAPDVSIFYGRKNELELLKQWILTENCRLVAIVGMAGIGKTALSVRCVRQIEEKFECIIWRSLRHAPSGEELARDLLTSLSINSENNLSPSLENPISQLIDRLQTHRCLIVLDNVETIMRSGELAGSYREQYRDYRELLQRLANTPHQSCLILTSREQLKEIALSAGKQLPIRSLKLAGLQQDAREILAEKNIKDSEEWQNLIELYRGNPLALKMVANTIKELFGGRVTAFLKHQTIIFGDLEDLLDEQFERLSYSEGEILYCLGLRFTALSLSQLLANIRFTLTPAEILEALESLLRRSLIERTSVDGEIVFDLKQPVVAQYVIDRAIDQICQEIQTISKKRDLSQMKLLGNYALFDRIDFNNNERFQSLVLHPIKTKLCIMFRDEKLIREKLEEILMLLADKTTLTVGYARKNIQSLLLLLNGDARVKSTMEIL